MIVQGNRFHLWLAATIFIMSLFSGCQNKESSEKLSISAIESSNPQNSAQSPGHTSLVYISPTDWIQQQPSSSMRHDQYELPATEKGGAGNTSNLQRYRRIG